MDPNRIGALLGIFFADCIVAAFLAGRGEYALAGGVLSGGTIICVVIWLANRPNAARGSKR